MTSLTEIEMRSAIAARNPAYNHRFYFGVVTTGVFCLPSCPSRAPRPENIRFFDDTDAATAAGFRPCKRCRPLERSPAIQTAVDTARYIERHADQTLTLADLAARVDLSPSHLQRTFKGTFGVSPRVYQDGLRLDRFRDSLRAGDEITGAIYDAGFGSVSRLYGSRTANIGMTPKAYRAGGAGEHISHATRHTALGPMMMAATDRGVCFVQFGNSAEALLEQLASEFPRATITASAAADTPELDAWIEALDDHISRDGPSPELPLDLRGTAFQMKVWRFLLGIPAGSVVSYAEVADGIGQPKSVRAAASACGKNRVGVLVPCHRVLRSDGSLGGYRWGMERKRALLDAERAHRTTGRDH